MPSSKSTAATLRGFSAILLWSVVVALARSLSEAMGPLAAGATVYCIGGAISLVPLASSSEWRRRAFSLPGSYAFVCGGLFVLYTVALYLGIGLAGTRLQVLEVGLLNYLWPALTLLLSIPVLGNRARWFLFPGTALALAGIFLVLVQDADVSIQSVLQNLAGNPAAYTLGIVAAISWGLYSTLARRLGESGRGGVHLFIPTTGAVLLVAAACFGRLPNPTELPLSVIAQAIFLGIVTSVSYRLWDSAMRGGNVAAVAAASYATPLLSTLVCAVHLTVMPGLNLWLGCLLLVSGSLISWKSVIAPDSRSLAGTA